MYKILLIQNINNNNINPQLKFINYTNKQSVWIFRFFGHYVNEVLTFLG